jgi:hypothetical protein
LKPGFAVILDLVGNCIPVYRYNQFDGHKPYRARRGAGTILPVWLLYVVMTILNESSNAKKMEFSQDLTCCSRPLGTSFRPCSNRVDRGENIASAYR